MFARAASHIALAFAFTLAFFTSVMPTYSAKDELQKLVVHEWGTFTTVSTANGEEQMWNPLFGPSELPAFVYQGDPNGNHCLIKCQLALARMETPVLYFYTDRLAEVSVKVGFPAGRISEWYPQARTTGTSIDWGRITVAPSAKENFPLDQSRSHYYPARETDAAPLLVKNGGKDETEKFLFYRGVGNFLLPLSIKLTGDKVVVGNRGQEIAQVILFENRGGRAGWSIHSKLRGEVTIARPKPDRAIDSLLCEIESALRAEGLYPKEAAAMVKTWHDSWFEEGLRVFYLLPRAETDKILPITISPAPTEMVRVMVGRVEIITPEMEKAILAAVEQFSDGNSGSRAAAVNTLRRYGRFADPVLRQALEGRNATTISNLAKAAFSR